VKLSGDAIKGCTAEIKKPDPEAEEGAKALAGRSVASAHRQLVSHL
jgi:hypothetical protein